MHLCHAAFWYMPHTVVQAHVKLSETERPLSGNQAQQNTQDAAPGGSLAACCGVVSQLCMTCIHDELSKSCPLRRHDVDPCLSKALDARVSPSAWIEQLRELRPRDRLRTIYYVCTPPLFHSELCNVYCLSPIDPNLNHPPHMRPHIP